MSEEEARELLASMTPGEIRQLAPVLHAIRRWVDVQREVSSDIVTEGFANRFALTLRIFHALHDRGQVLTKKSFEFAFKEAVEADGVHSAEITHDPTFAGRDLLLDDSVAVSLKTEAAMGIKDGRITISKLMESAWTKGCKEPADFLATVPRITSHLRSYGRLFVLRVFGRLESTQEVRYDLVEIPVSILLAAEKLAVEDFGAITSACGTTATVRGEGAELYKLVFDGSDQKITVRDLRVSRCRWHASWTLT